MNKRFLVAIFTFIFLQGASYSANWQELQTSNNNKAYIDLDSVVIKLPKLYYTVKYEKDSNYYIFDFVSNYNDKTTKIVCVDKYEGNGKFVASSQKEEKHIMSQLSDAEEKEAKINPIEISPNSINEAAYNRVYAIIKANNDRLALMKTMLVPIKLKKGVLEQILFSDRFEIIMQLKNTQDKTIKDFEGNIEVYDTSNNKLATLNIKGSRVEKQANQTFSYSWNTWDYSNNNQMSEIYRRNNKNLIFVFNPTKITFEDNTGL